MTAAYNLINVFSFTVERLRRTAETAKSHESGTETSLADR